MYCEAAKSRGNLLCLLVQGQAGCLYKAAFVTVLKMQIYLCVWFCVFPTQTPGARIDAGIILSCLQQDVVTHMLGLKPLCKTTLCD